MFLEGQAAQACEGLQTWHDMPCLFYCPGRINTILHGSGEIKRVMAEFIEGDIFKAALGNRYRGKGISMKGNFGNHEGRWEKNW